MDNKLVIWLPFFILVCGCFEFSDVVVSNLTFYEAFNGYDFGYNWTAWIKDAGPTQQQLKIYKNGLYNAMISLDSPPLYLDICFHK